MLNHSSKTVIGKGKDKDKANDKLHWMKDIKKQMSFSLPHSIACAALELCSLKKKEDEQADTHKCGNT